MLFEVVINVINDYYLFYELVVIYKKLMLV